MAKDKLWLGVWLLSAAAGLIIFVLFFNDAFPIASIDIRLSKKEVLEKAAEFVTAQGFSLEGFDETVLFDSDYSASVYLQKTQGIKKANTLIREGIPVWFWRVRWFKELNKDGFSVYVDPASGKIINFEYSLLDNDQGENLSPEHARAKAQDYLVARGFSLDDFELKDSTTKKQKNRTDYYFIWQKKDYSIQDANLRLAVFIYGDKLGYYSRYLDIPEEFLRDLGKEVSFGQVLSIIPMVFIFFIVIAAVFVLIVEFKKDKINWKFGLVFAVCVVALAVFSFLNSMPLLWSSYPDTMSKAVFITIACAGALISGLLFGLLIFLFGCSGESLARGLWPEKFSFLGLRKYKGINPANIMPSVVVGYSLGFIFLGYVTLFYLIGTKFFHIWMPPEVEYSNILGTTMPFLFPLTIAASAAVSEEFMFRLFTISFFKRYTKQIWLGVLVSSVIWAFAHSNYPVFPAYVRGIELTVAGIVFGIVFLKYGLASVLIGHFVIDAALVGLPLLKSHNAYFISSGVIVVALALSPVFVFGLLAYRKK